MHDTVLTTHEPYLVGEGVHVKVHPDDTNTNTEASLVFNRDFVPVSPISQVGLEMPSQAHRDDVVIHPTNVETTLASTAIVMLMGSKNQESIHPVIEVSSATEEPSSSSHFVPDVLTLEKWLKPVNPQDMVGASSSQQRRLTAEENNDLYLEQLGPLTSIHNNLSPQIYPLQLIKKFFLNTQMMWKNKERILLMKNVKGM